MFTIRPTQVFSFIGNVYTDKCSIVHAIENNVDGRVKREWVPIPDVQNPPELLENVCCQFKRGLSSVDDNGNRFIDTDRALLDIPRQLEGVSTRNRVIVGGCTWKIRSFQDDVGIATRIELRIQES